MTFLQMKLGTGKKIAFFYTDLEIDFFGLDILH